MSRKAIGTLCTLALLSIPFLTSAQSSCTSLSRGSTGPSVSAVQKILYSSYANFPQPTGYFGPLTEAAVRQWQKEHGIVSSGTPATTGYGAVGPKTRAAMGLSCTPATAVKKSADVAALIQTLLAQVKAVQAKIAASLSASTTPSMASTVPVTTTPPASCSFNGQNVASGSSVAAYLSSSVPSGEQCISQERTCSGGTLSGSYQYALCAAEIMQPPPPPPAPLPTGSITVSSPIIVAGPTDIAKTLINAGTAQQGDGIMDAPLTTFVVGDNRYWFHSDYLQHFKFSGTLDQPLQTKQWGKTSQQLFRNPANVGGYWWIVNDYQDPAGLLLFIHVEGLDQTGPVATATDGKGRIGLAWSTDNGESFTYLGNIISPRNDPNTNPNIEGTPYLVKDGYFYVYFKDFCSNGSNAVARAPVAEVINAAKNGTVSSWKKYSNGNWSADGLGGDCTAINIEDGISHTDAAYSTYTGKYYMLMTYGNWSGSDTWIKMSESTDGINWTSDKTIVDQPAASVTQGYQYATIVDASGAVKNGTVGQKFYIYAAKEPYITAQVSVYRWLVDLDGPGNTHKLSDEFSLGTQGTNNWYYQYGSQGSFTNMLWDPGNTGWIGSEQGGYPIIWRGAEHPGAANDAIATWVATSPGSITISGTAFKSDPSCGNGVHVSILQNATELWSADIAYNNTTGVSHSITAHVALGDSIHFIVAKIGDNNYCDSTDWDPSIRYN